MVLDKKIGIIGGGQLGKMMTLSAKAMGFKVTTLDASSFCPSASISDELIVSSFDDKVAIRKLAESTDVLTYEFEHINSDILLELEAEGYKIYPSAKSLVVIQNKFEQKKVLAESGVKVTAFCEILNCTDMEKFGEENGFPFMLKTSYGGYDGKGNCLVETKDRIDESFKFLGGEREGIKLYAEKFLDFEKEVSVISCRGVDGEIVVFPVAENIHEKSVLRETKVPANISQESERKAVVLAKRVLEIFQGVGTFCVEMFVDKSGEIYVNEVAPRPHNSGHYTIEGCFTSQFEQHIRAITGLPFGSCKLKAGTGCSMINLLGEEGFDGAAIYEGIEKAYKIHELKIHIYGKNETKPSRKMGHLTVVSETVAEASRKCNEAKALIKVVAKKL